MRLERYAVASCIAFVFGVDPMREARGEERMARNIFAFVELAPNHAVVVYR